MITIIKQQQLKPSVHTNKLRSYYIIVYFENDCSLYLIHNNTLTL